MEDLPGQTPRQAWLKALALTCSAGRGEQDQNRVLLDQLCEHDVAALKAIVT